MGETHDKTVRKLANGAHYAAIGPREISENVSSLDRKSVV